MQNIEEISVKYCKKVGTKREKLLNKLGIFTVKDLLYYFPRDYQDWSKCKSFENLNVGEKTLTYGEIVGIAEHKSKNNLSIIKVLLKQNNLFLPIVFFNQVYLTDILKRGKILIVYGKVELYYGQIQITQVEYWEQFEKEEDIKTFSGIYPLYTLTSKLTQKIMRSIIKEAIKKYINYEKDYFSPYLLEKFQILNLSETIKNLHFPENFKRLEEAKKSMRFREGFFPILFWELMKRKILSNRYTIRYSPDLPLIRKFIKRLPFKLTGAQKRVLREIKESLEKPIPMRRLLQGDVGSGKTIVAFISALIPITSGYQVALMAPTEILAKQHYHNFKKLCKEYGLTKIINLAFLGSSLKTKEKKEILAKIENNEVNFVIGTHALFQDKVKFNNLSYVIIDEQHRFGVEQRGALLKKASNPDALIMTATPIPRTLTMTLYGDLEVSIIDELPKGRKGVKTKIITASQKNICIDFCISYLKKGGQIYVICPLIEESEKLDLKATTGAYEEYSRYFKDFKCAILHGKLSAEEKEKIMRLFKKNEINVLISTVVIEVGIDVPNANVMIIEHPERFGLSQLHQLRGRIGRGNVKGYCFLMLDKDISKESYNRLKIFEKITDGFKLSEYDLQFRGPGEFMGTKQHGFLDFKFLDIVKDKKFLNFIRKEVRELLKKDPFLSRKEHFFIKREFERKYKKELKYLEIH